MKDFEIQITKAALWVGALELVAALIGFLILYYVLKAAIRDGIRESGLVERKKLFGGGPNVTTEPAPLPDMRAER